MEKAYLSEIWVYCETREKELTAGAKELLGKATELAKEADCKVAAVLFSGAEKEAASFGAEKILERNIITVFRLYFLLPIIIGNPQLNVTGFGLNVRYRRVLLKLTRIKLCPNGMLILLLL